MYGSTTRIRLPRLIEELPEALALELVTLLARDLLEDGHHVLLVVLEVFQSAGGLHGVADGALEAVGVELGLVPVELLRQGGDRLAVQRVRGLTLQILEDPPKLPQMPEIIVQTLPP